MPQCSYVGSTHVHVMHSCFTTCHNAHMSALHMFSVCKECHAFMLHHMLRTFLLSSFMSMNAPSTCSACSHNSAQLLCYSQCTHRQPFNALKLDIMRDHGSKNAPHARIPNVQNENHVLVEVVEATAMMHHTQLALQDVYNHHCRYVEMASHLHITVH